MPSTLLSYVNHPLQQPYRMDISLLRLSAHDFWFDLYLTHDGEAFNGLDFLGIGHWVLLFRLLMFYVCMHVSWEQMNGHWVVGQE